MTKQTVSSKDCAVEFVDPLDQGVGPLGACV